MNASLLISAFCLMLTFSLRLESQSLPVNLRAVDGSSEIGVLSQFTPDGRVELVRADNTKLSIDLKQVAALSYGNVRPPESPAAFPNRLRFELAGGDVLMGEVVDSTFDDVRVENAAFGVVTVSLERLNRVLVPAQMKDASPRIGADMPRDRDIIFMRSKAGIDHLIGEVSHFQKTGVVFNWGDRKESNFVYEKDRVMAVLLADAEAPKPASGLQAAVYTKDGSRLSGRIDRVEGGAFYLASTAGSVRIQENEIAEVVFSGGTFVWLSDLEAASFVETPLIGGGLLYGLLRDFGPDRTWPRLGGRLFPKALVVHSRSEVSYELKGGFSAFSAIIGVDDATIDRPVRGAVSFSVLLDDQVVFGPKTLRSGETPDRVLINDLKGRSRLILRADFADNLHYNGWAVWGGAMLVR